MLTQPKLTPEKPSQPDPITKYTKARIRRGNGLGAQEVAETKMLAADPAISLYLRDIASSRGNNGILSETTRRGTIEAWKNFIQYASLDITDHTASDLIDYKTCNPSSRNIEKAIKSFSLDPPNKYHANMASKIMGTFRRNFAPLAVKVETHFPPAEENCTLGIFLDIYKHLTAEQQDMIQWGLHVPERAKAAYRVPLEDIDMTRSDYAIVTIHGSKPNANGIRSKMRVDHPCLVPIDFAKRVIASARAAKNNCPFPTHEWQWAQISAFAKREYNVRLVSNKTRKLFIQLTDRTTLKPSIAAFIMGDKTKLAETGHLRLIYDPLLRTSEREAFIDEYNKSGATEALTLPRT